MRHILFLTLAYTALVLESAPWTRGGGALPSSLWLVAAAAIWTMPGSRAVLWCALLGFLSDCLANGPIGIGVALGAVLGWLFSAVRLQGRLDSAPAFFLLTLSLTTIFALTAEPARRLFERAGPFNVALLQGAIGRGCLTGLAGVILFIGIRSVLPRTSPSLDELA